MNFVCSDFENCLVLPWRNELEPDRFLTVVADGRVHGRCEPLDQERNRAGGRLHAFALGVAAIASATGSGCWLAAHGDRGAAVVPNSRHPKALDLLSALREPHLRFNHHRGLLFSSRKNLDAKAGRTGGHHHRDHDGCARIARGDSQR
jgi:hypothetical protein